MDWGRQTGSDHCFSQGVCSGCGCWSGAGGLSHLVLHPGTPAIICSFLLRPQGQLAPDDGWEIILGANMEVFVWEDKIWGHSCCLHPSKGALWAEEQAYCIGLPRVKSGSVVGVTERQRELTRFEIKFQIKPFLGITIGKILMSLSLSIHICKLE